MASSIHSGQKQQKHSVVSDQGLHCLQVLTVDNMVSFSLFLHPPTPTPTNYWKLNFCFRYARLCEKMAELFASSGDPDQMLHSDLDLHCLPLILFEVSRLKWDNT